jgi:hypothetical protein
MNKMRIFGLVAGALVIVAAILIGLGFNLAPPAEGAGAANAGIGDLQRYEGNLAASSGFGDLQAYEQKLAAGSNAVVFTGFGDLQAYEQKLAAGSAAVVFTGFGDLQAYEQKLALTSGALPSGSQLSTQASDLRHPEWALALGYTSPQANSSTYTGFGDAQSYEQVLAHRSSAAFSGMGELQRLEAQP